MFSAFPAARPRKIPPEVLEDPCRSSTEGEGDGLVPDGWVGAEL